MQGETQTDAVMEWHDGVTKLVKVDDGYTGGADEKVVEAEVTMLPEARQFTHAIQAFGTALDPILGRVRKGYAAFHAELRLKP